MQTQTAAGAQSGVHYLDLEGRRVFITGGGSGIGAALVTGFAAQGAQVAFVDLDDTASAALAEQMAERGWPKPWWRQCDVTDIAALQRAIVDAALALGDFHVLVNNVGNDDRHQLDTVTPAYWERCVAVNQRAAFFAIQSVVPGMRRLGGGSIINLGSIGWQIKNRDYPVYATAKSSASGLTRGLARELGAERIRINLVTPGWVMTERQVNLWLDEQGEQALRQHQCLPDKIVPEDIAAMVLFLASGQSRACTAQEFTVDAGWS